MTASSDPHTLKIFVVAGEHSGDALGAKLIAALKAAHAGPIQFSGVGGEEMAHEGFRFTISNRRRRGDGPDVDPAAPAAHRPARLSNRRRGARRRSGCRRHHRQSGIHAPDRETYSKARAAHSDHRLCQPECVGLASRTRQAHAPLHRPRAGVATLRAGCARAPRRAALHVRRASSDRKTR